MKIFHEAPKSIFRDVQANTDGDYALVHLFETDQEYYELFREAIDAGREVILDNSIFELEVAFDAEEFASWVRKLQPTWYIVPDALDDAEKTIAQFYDFINKYPNLPGKRIGVLQGKSNAELLACYVAIADKCDMVAVSFNYQHWLEPKAYLPPTVTDEEKFVIGRTDFIDDLVGYMSDIGVFKPLHLLGCALPQEFEFYSTRKERAQIYSVDTSNPVVHGMHGIYYEPYGLAQKLKTKLHTLMDAKVTPEQWSAVMFNILEFRRFCNVGSTILPDRE